MTTVKSRYYDYSYFTEFSEAYTNEEIYPGYMTVNCRGRISTQAVENLSPELCCFAASQK